MNPLSHCSWFVLVADIKRASDDQAMHDHFQKFLRQMILDQRTQSLVIVLTGADVRTTENQLHYLSAKQCYEIQQMEQEIQTLGDKVDELKTQQEAMGIVTSSDPTKRLWSIINEMNATNSRLKTAEAAKDTYIAHQRSAHVEDAFLQLYHRAYHSIVKDSEPPSLPVFCVGSTDFNQLLATDQHHRVPLVFTDPEDTGIPRLARHIQNFGYKQIISDISTLVTNCQTLWEDIESFVLSSGQEPRLDKYEKAAKNFAENLRDSIDAARKEMRRKIDDRINELEETLRIEAQKAAERSINVIKELGEKYTYQVYRAIMRRRGEWRSTDLNENLMKGILDENASSIWHDFFNNFLKSELQSFSEAISNDCDETMQSIKQRARHLATIAPRVNRACELINPRDMIDRARQEYLSLVLTMQRELSCGLFKGLLRDELEDHYLDVAAEYGPGMFRRMKDMNEEQFAPRKAKELYSRLIDRVMEIIHLTRNAGEKEFDAAVERLHSSIQRSLVCMHSNDQTAKIKQRNIQQFLGEHCSEPLAEVTAIVDRYAPR
ncbi:hypothetical protein K503DRAFT_391931 [Rhizopogon vinicolor AM-OR11-026]|uniref:DUF7605 domain-containing protein n=1 Tax=Rhizopogon vinicolor AM-OR11-026 TaxID=1314800 RepID=A0A1B7MRE7_9AGAM|nr:hypothetical protein K503DRAFT_391931 [Rhizopogon vinicolor AM-OR11-026]